MDCKSYESVLVKMSSFVFEEFATKKKNPIAYTLKRGKGYDTGALKIFLPPVNKGQDLNHYLFVHEAGHIIFNHSLNSTQTEKILEERLETVYEENIHLFRNKKDFFNTFYSKIFNIAQDFEVNSKFFTKEEFNYLNKITSAYVGAPCKGMWPEDYGFPIGETWRFYLNMIIEDLPRFIKDYKNNKKNQNEDKDQNEDDESQSNEQQPDSGDMSDDFDGDPSESSNSGNGDSENSDGESSNNENENSDSGSGNDENDGASGSGEDSDDEEPEPLTEEEMEEIEREVKETSEEALQEREETKAAEKEDAKPGNGSSYSKYTSDRTPDITETLKYIQKKIIHEEVETKRDLLYKSNRLGDSVIRPKDLEIEVERTQNFYVILDVSGSMSTGFITDVILNFKKLSKRFGKNSRIIFWNTDLVQDKTFREDIELCKGGGTHIWAAFDYLDDTYKDLNKSLLFVISDVEDDMDHWHRSLSKFKNDKRILISLNKKCSDYYQSLYPEDFNEIFITSQEKYLEEEYS